MSEFGLKIQVYKFFDVIQKRKRTMEWYIYALLFVIAMVSSLKAKNKKYFHQERVYHGSF